MEKYLGEKQQLWLNHSITLYVLFHWRQLLWTETSYSLNGDSYCPQAVLPPPQKAANFLKVLIH